MKRTLVLSMLVVSSLFAGPVEVRELGPVQAVEVKVEVDAPTCVKNLSVSTEVIGGGYGARVQIKARCEVRLPDAERIVYSGTLSQPFGDGVTLVADAQGYSIALFLSPTGLTPDLEAAKKTATEKILRSVPNRTYTVKALRTL